MLDRLFDPLLRAMLRPPVRPARALPEELARAAEDVTIAGARMPLKAWLVRPAVAPAACAVFIHGWSSDGGRMAPLAADVVAAGIAVLLVDLPGHGRTGPTATYDVQAMVDDIRRAGDWVLGREDLRGVALGLVGYSFGGLGAYASAALDPRWRVLVVLAAPAGPMEATRLYLDGKRLPGWILVKMLRRSTIRMLGVDPDDYSAERTLPSLRVQALIVHGELDQVVPVAHGRRLAELLPAGRGSLMVVPGAGHSDLIGDAGVGTRVATFLAEALGRRPS